MNDNKQGIMTRAFVYLNGKEIEMKLAVIKHSEKYYGNPEELSFVSEERPNPKVVVRSFYSGGLCGAGIDSCTLREAIEGRWKEKVEVLAEGAEAAFKWLDEQERIRKEKYDKFIAESEESVKKLNELPEIFYIEGLSNFRIKRTTAQFNASRSRSIQYTIMIEYKNMYNEWVSINGSYFKTKSGDILAKKFQFNMSPVYEFSLAEAKETLKKIYEAQDKIKALCKKTIS
jgi:hypothetical protein